MDHFLFDQEGFQVNNDEILCMTEQNDKIQGENIFGLEYKENMFEDPSAFSTDLTHQETDRPIFTHPQESCATEQTAATPIVSTQVQHPPCRCYRINCQKKYCQCFRNGRKCTKRCICIDCHNQPFATRLKVNVEEFWQVSYMFTNMQRKC